MKTVGPQVRSRQTAAPPRRRLRGAPKPDAAVPRKRKIKRVVVIALGVLGAILLVIFGAAFILFRHDLSEARSRLRRARRPVNA